MPDQQEIPYEVPEEERRRYIIPPRERPAGDSGYFEALTKAVFMAGFSWRVVFNKWPNFQQAFQGFDVDTVTGYGDEEVERLLGDASIIRNGQKIRATIENAHRMREIADEYGTFHDYLRTLDGRPYHVRRDEIASRFKWLGRTGSFTFLYMVGEDVPRWEER